MAHWAEIDENNIVTRVLVTDNNLPNEGEDFLLETYGGTWIQTSYNKNFRKKFAGVGDYYHEELDAFIPPKPFESWVLNKDTCIWEAPVTYPQDDKFYIWNEEKINWDEAVI